MTYKPFAEYIVYDGVNLSDHFDIRMIDVDPLPALSTVSTKVPGSPGEVFHSKEIGTRNIVMEMSVKGFERDPLTVSMAWRRVAYMLMKEEPKPLNLGDGREIQAVPISSTELKRLGRRGIANITFTAFDPFFYGPERSIPLTTGQNTMHIAGDYKIFPTIELSGTSGAVSVTNYLTGEQVRIPSVLNANAPVVIDMKAMRCTINGNYLAVDMGVTDFFALEPGNNDIRLSGGTGTLRYREAYL